MKHPPTPQEARTLACAVYGLHASTDRATRPTPPPAVRTTAYGWRGASRTVHGDAWPEAVRVRPTYEHPPSSFLTALAGLFWFAALIGGAAFAWIAWG